MQRNPFGVKNVLKDFQLKQQWSITWEYVVLNLRVSAKIPMIPMRHCLPMQKDRHINLMTSIGHLESKYILLSMLFELFAFNFYFCYELKKFFKRHSNSLPYLGHPRRVFAIRLPGNILKKFNVLHPFWLHALSSITF